MDELENKRPNKMVQETWQRLKAILITLEPNLHTCLHPGVDEATIVQMEQQLGVFFPEEVKAFFRLQNGSKRSLLGSWEFLSLEQIFYIWQQFKSQAALLTPLQQTEDVPWYGWDESWFPLLWSAPSRWLFIRIDPKEEELEIDGNDSWEEKLSPWFGIPRERLGTLFISALQPAIQPFFVASSICELLESLVASLERGEYRYDQSRQKLRPVLSPLPLTEIKPFTVEMPFGFAEEAVARSEQHETYGTYPGHCITAYQNESVDQTNTLALLTVSRLGELLRSLLVRLAPEIEEDLRSGASLGELQQMEQRLHVSFPEEVKSWYIWCNGTASNSQGDKGLMDLWSWYSLEDMHHRWEGLYHGDSFPPKSLTSLDQRIQPVRWHPKWLPFMSHEDGSLLCIDVAPGPLGQEGQIILLFSQWHDYQFRPFGARTAPIFWVAPSLHRFFALLARDFLQDTYMFDESSRMLWSQEGLAYMGGQERLRGILKQRREKIERGNAAREEMQEVWQCLRTVLENLGPDLVERLRPGANRIELARVEKWFGFSFPDQVRAFFSGHNGSDGPIFENWELFSLEKMYEEHKIMEQLLPPGPFSERQDSSWYQWDASWLPLLGAGSSLRVAFNLQPLMWGEQEVVFLYSKDGTVSLPIIAASIPEFLKELVNSLEAGCYAYDMQTQHLHMVKSGSPLSL